MKEIKDPSTVGVVMFHYPKIYLDIKTGDIVELVGFDRLNRGFISTNSLDLFDLDYIEGNCVLLTSLNNTSTYIQDIVYNIWTVLTRQEDEGDYNSSLERVYGSFLTDDRIISISAIPIIKTLSVTGLNIKIREPLGKEIIAKTKLGLPVILTPIRFKYRVVEEWSGANEFLSILYIDGPDCTGTMFYDYPLFIYWNKGTVGSKELNNEIGDIIVTEFIELSNILRKIILPVIINIDPEKAGEIIEESLNIEDINKRISDKFNF